MGEFRVPFQAADSEFVEKRSRFISHLLPVESDSVAASVVQFRDFVSGCVGFLIGCPTHSNNQTP